MPQRSAGMLVFRRKGRDAIELLLVHPGGPFWAKKDAGAWSIPKGLVEDGDEDDAATAVREFSEETGFACPVGEKVDLGEVKMKSGKLIRAWAVEGEVDPSQLKSNLFSIEWPPKSGKRQEFPEIDRGQYFSPEEARLKLHTSLVPFVDRLLRQLGMMNGDAKE
ncbi:NUDIX domain-containing protein [Roseimicrobium sp. ORNL1]|uniref:NUDIX domain-containing protein n=1 Tax=Roseimicrobium sp. ORNL1 TaxID=2711231 RepID=UPI0013E20822|nr:NUDIX domain-containing protein [Roseimicrobium sp. ORNL1]QIF02766.1 NUDIX domain-containing protein [Roseimicrobium sp. ORNL1]